jgi:hypothetical protein
LLHKQDIGTYYGLLRREVLQRINEAVHRIGADRLKQTNVMSQSVQALRMEIGGLLQEMILDDDSQHRKLKQARRRPTPRSVAVCTLLMKKRNKIHPLQQRVC